MQTNKPVKKEKKRRKTAKKIKYRIKNWKEYNQALINRGDITFWINKEEIEEKWYAAPSGKPGRQEIYSNFAIEAALTIGKVFGQRLRQTHGLVSSLFKIMDIDVDVPSYSTLSRREKYIKVCIPIMDKYKVDFIIDSSGAKVYGEGEWKVRKHGWSKHRTWRKLHIAIDSDGEIRAGKLTENSIADCHAVDDLLNQEQEAIENFFGDGAYDKEVVYGACREKEVSSCKIPPQKNAKIKQHGNCNSPPHPRDENLRQIRKTTRKRWKIESGYHKRSLVENTMFRHKTILGERLYSRIFENQKTELLINLSILNKMFQIGMPISYPVV